MNYSTIIYQEEEPIGIIRLHRPERMNAVIEEMYLDIQNVLNKVRRDHKIRVLILTGSVLKKGDLEKQAFCAGADLKKHASGDRSEAQQREYIELAHATTEMIYEFSKPIIAAVNGPARGAGSEMALNCDFIFMAENASIAFPEIGLGTFVGGGVTKLLVEALGMTLAKELVYTGRVIDGGEAVSLGLALRCYPIDNLMKEAMAFALELAEKAPISLQLAKTRLQDSSNLDMQTALKFETEAILACMKTEDWHEGLKAFGEKRKPVYRGR